MNGDIVTRYKWFWLWQDDLEEKWLEKMAHEGCHLVSVGLPCIYTFKKGQPEDFSYRLDYRRFAGGNKEEYIQLFKDSGWEYLGEMSLWQYFRKEKTDGNITEIFTDTSSKVAKYNRVLGFTAIVYLALIAIFLERVITAPVHPWWGHVEIFIGIVVLLMTYALVRILFRIRRLVKTSVH